MKKSILFIALCMGLAACGGPSDPSAGKDKNEQAAGVDTAGAAKAKGLMAASDCSTCHRPDTKLVGPSFKDIAAKYTADDVDQLAVKIIKGGAGKWGDVPMTPHPSLAESEAKEMVRYILTQK